TLAVECRILSLRAPLAFRFRGGHLQRIRVRLRGCVACRLLDATGLHEVARRVVVLARGGVVAFPVDVLLSLLAASALVALALRRVRRRAASLLLAARPVSLLAHEASSKLPIAPGFPHAHWAHRGTAATWEALCRAQTSAAVGATPFVKSGR